MARPRKNDHLKHSLLESGMRLLTLNGYHGTGIKQILDEVNVPKGSFYNFFTSKEHFVESIILHYGQCVSNEFADIIKQYTHEPALVQLWLSFKIKVTNRYQAEQPCACLLGALSAEIAQASSLCREAIVVVENGWLASLSDYFLQAQQENDIRLDIPADEIAVSFYNCWQGSLLEYQLRNDPNLLMQRLRTFIHALLTDSARDSIVSSAYFNKEITRV